MYRHTTRVPLVENVQINIYDVAFYINASHFKSESPAYKFPENGELIISFDYNFMPTITAISIETLIDILLVNDINNKLKYITLHDYWGLLHATYQLKCVRINQKIHQFGLTQSPKITCVSVNDYVMAYNAIGESYLKTAIVMQIMRQLNEKDFILAYEIKRLNAGHRSGLTIDRAKVEPP